MIMCMLNSAVFPNRGPSEIDIKTSSTGFATLEVIKKYWETSQFDIVWQKQFTEHFVYAKKVLWKCIWGFDQRKSCQTLH